MRTTVLMILMLSLAAKAQTFRTDGVFLKTRDLAANANVTPELTGVLSEDLFAAQPTPAVRESLATVETKSALLAGAFSLVIPGAGQVYNRDYWTGAAFLVVEAAAWTVNLMWTQKGNNQETFYENYANGSANYRLPNGQLDPYGNAHYSVVRYAQWIKANYAQIEQVNNTTTQQNQLIQTGIDNLFNGSYGNQTVAPWNQVNWYYLNQVEGALGGYFSHQLFPHENFEYYEEIGKYPQFRQGWTDSPFAQGDTNFIQFMDYSTPESGYYMDQRGKANSLFLVASTALSVVLVNHFASAIEAAIAAHVHNKNITTHVSLAPLPLHLGYQAQFQLAVAF